MNDINTTKTDIPSYSEVVCKLRENWTGSREEAADAIEDLMSRLHEQEAPAKRYMLRIDNNYYAGKNKKYPDMYDISGLGALGAKRMELSEAESIKDCYVKLGRTVEIVEYDPEKELAKCLDNIIELDDKRRNYGVDCGYAIKNNAQQAKHYLFDAVYKTF